MEQKKSGQIPVFLIMAGILCLMLKLALNLGPVYPKYELGLGTHDPGWEFQYNTTDLYYGTNYTLLGKSLDGIVSISAINYNEFQVEWFYGFPVFNVIGYVLLLAGFAGLKKNWKRNLSDIELDHMTGKKKKVNPVIVLNYGAVAAVVGILFQIVIFVLPFFAKSAQLSNVVFCVGIASFFVQILTLYAVVFALNIRLWETSFRRDRRFMLTCWFVLFILKLIVALCSWSHVPGMTILYYVIALGVTVFWLVRIFKLRTCIMKEAD